MCVEVNHEGLYTAPGAITVMLWLGDHMGLSTIVDEMASTAIGNRNRR